MEKYYLFKINGSIDKIIFSEFVKGNFKDINSLKFISSNQGYIVSDLDIYLTLTNALNVFSADTNLMINILITHKLKKEYFALLEKSFNYFLNSAFTLYEIALKMILNNDYALFNILVSDFENIPSYLLETCLMYVKSNMNAIVTSKKIYIHRNTFKQRLEHFIKLTSLDIRDFYNASYFLLMENYIENRK